ncbi:putative FmdB family regulatory protein [Leucobacter luti]|uniref:FmdB family zinc ribbon protein n=1 Tax=Leucobacter luti TaxID=340320 RepID=UPI00104BE3A4|nr:zinc ribbon domain-containing protein [Leucobacter luti]MCW2287254.1 putative FmdB family regulatory protein [Leucobacter luti]TCK41479.1 putative FmdB family regulatory protein [Leucobacter luti]
MPNYSYQCAEGCRFEALFPMTEVPSEMACRGCAAPAKRVITAPHLSAAGTAAFGLMDRAAASAHEPTVVSGPPPRGPARTQPVTHNPLHAKLPRP